jgi:hypothetical protein
MRRVILLCALFSFVALQGCNSSNPGGPSTTGGSLTGSWVLVREVETETVGGQTDTYEETYTVQESYLALSFSGTQVTIYGNEGSETVVETEQYSASGGQIYLYGESLTYAIQGGQLVLTMTETYGADSYTYRMYFAPYSGAMPPSGWPPLAVAPTVPTNATSVAVNGAEINRSLAEAATDWYSFSATSGTTYIIETSGSVDTYARLYGVEGSNLIQLSSNDDGGSDLNARIQWTCPTSGTYYFSIEGFDEYESGNYGVSVSTSAGLTKATASGLTSLVKRKVK